jgi:acyl dehydratase
MGAVMRFEVGMDVPPVSKMLGQEQINLFEASGAHEGPSIFTDPETAQRTLGMGRPVASGRMTLSFAVETLRRFFGERIYNHTGTADLRFIRPTRAGDTVTVRGKVSDIRPEANGSRVMVELTVQNANGETTAAGLGSAIVPAGLLPPGD